MYKIAIARALGPDNLGIVSLVLALIGIFSIALSFGIPAAVIKYLAEFKAKKIDPAPLVSGSLIVIFLAALVASFLCFALSKTLAIDIFHNPSATYPFKIISIAIFLMLIGKLFSSYSMGIQRMEFASLLDITQTLIQFGTTIILLRLSYGLIGAVWSIVLGYASMVFLGAILLSRVLRFRMPKRSDTTILREILRFSGPFYVSSILELISSWADIVMVGFFLSTEQVGYYSIAVLVAGTLGTFTRPLNNTLFPVFSEAYAMQDKAKIESIFNISLRYTACIAIPASLGVFILAEPIIMTFFGKQYAPAIQAMTILAFGVAFQSLRAVGTKFIAAIGRPDMGLRLIALAVSINLILNFILIPRYGISGAAISSTISLGSLMVLCFLFIRMKLDINFEFIPKCISASIVMATIIAIILRFAGANYLTIPIYVLGGAVIYLIFLYIFGGVTSFDKEIFWRLHKKVLNKWRDSH